MKKYFTLLGLFIFVVSTQSFAQNLVAGRMNEVFQRTNLASGVLDPWEITYGPDDSLWITESKAYVVSKMGKNGGARRTILDISRNATFLPLADRTFDLQFIYSTYGAQGGLAGLAIHPDFRKPVSPKNYVYISYIHKFVADLSVDGPDANSTADSAGVFFTNQIVRFTYNTSTGLLESPITLCDSIPGSNDHNSQRMIIAPVNGVNYLFYAAGDMGGGQFKNKYRANHAQDSSYYEGKILRFNLEEDADATSQLDKWIPNDNPFSTTTPLKQSAVWALGIRNNQGFAYDSVRNILYGSSHGPYSDDEINIIERQKNYGHPLVIGKSADGNYNNSSAGTVGSSLPLIVSESANAALIGSSRYKDPLFSAYVSTQAIINGWYLNPINNGSWPSEGWSGLGLYNYSAIPGWKNSLLAASLKWGRVLRVKLDDASGAAILPINGSDTASYFGSQNRFRDMAISPDGKSIYVVMDNSTTSSGPSAGNPIVPNCTGCIQKYTFIGYSNVSNTSAIQPIAIAAGKPNIIEDANSITIDATNAAYWVPVTDTSGNIVAEIFMNAKSPNLGAVTTKVFSNSGTIREKGASKSLYIDRNITITPTAAPGSAIRMRFYITDAEFQALKNGTNTVGIPSGVGSITNVAIFKNNDVASSSMIVAATALATTNQAAFGSGYVLQADVTLNAGVPNSFYFASTTATLPINLVSFKGAVSNDVAILKWVTEDEKGTSAFVLERSLNSRDYDAVTTLKASTADGQQQYAYADSAFSKLSTPAVYYRLKIVDADGKSRYSSVVTLYPSISNKGTVVIHPNPVVDNATVEINAAFAEKANWQLTDMAGKTVLQHAFTLTKGKNVININLTKVPAGIYFLKVSGNSISQAIKLQKQ